VFLAAISINGRACGEYFFLHAPLAAIAWGEPQPIRPKRSSQCWLHRLTLGTSRKYKACQ
jgi:hypothetical protein